MTATFLLLAFAGSLGYTDQFVISEKMTPEFTKAVQVSATFPKEHRMAKKVRSSKEFEIFSQLPLKPAHRYPFHDLTVDESRNLTPSSNDIDIWEPSLETLRKVISQGTDEVDQRNIYSKLCTTYSQSNCRSLDFAGAHDGAIFVLFKNKLYNNHDFGNLLWGAAMKQLGYNMAAVKVGSECNAILNTYKQNSELKKPWHGLCLSGDSRADQQAIKIGYSDPDLNPHPKSTQRGRK